MTISKNPCLILAACLLLLSAACKKGSQDQQEPGQSEPAVYDRGAPVGEAVKKTIGQEGGTLTSQDNRIQMSVPAGALAAPTEVSIQQVSNTLPGSPCPTYRLQPEGIEFQKPVTLTFTYEAADLDSTAEDALFMAYQSASGIWKFIPKTKLDKASRKLSVETRHFSDWTPYALFWLRAEKKVLKVGEATGVDVFSANDFADLKPDLSEIGIARERVLRNSKNIRNWAATRGTVVASQDVAVYTAPGRKPLDPVAVVSVEIHNFIPPALYDNRGGPATKLILMEEIAITDDTYWLVKHRGRVHEGIPGKCTYITGEDGDGHFWVAGWHSETQGFSGIIYGLSAPRVGNFPWHNGDSYDTDLHKSYMLFLDVNRQLYAPETWWLFCNDDVREHRASPGGISITKVEELKGVVYVEGKITATLWNGHNDCNPAIDSEVEITFRLAPKIMSEDD